MHGGIESLIQAGGILLVTAIVFAESGLLVGFFLPGDSLLVSAGFLAAQGHMNFPLLVVAVILAAIAGDSVGYWIGTKAGKRIMEKEDSLFFHKDHIERANRFYEKYGSITIVIARFVAIVRTFAPFVAGMARMDYRKFVMYNAVGGILWGAGVTTAGYWMGRVLGHTINLDKYIVPIFGLIMIFSIGPAIYHLFKTPENRAKLKRKITRSQSKPAE